MRLMLGCLLLTFSFGLLFVCLFNGFVGFLLLFGLLGVCLVFGCLLCISLVLLYFLVCYGCLLGLLLLLTDLTLLLFDCLFASVLTA